jgi:uncharacterized protein YabE (DUF348 family)
MRVFKKLFLFFVLFLLIYYGYKYLPFFNHNSDRTLSNDSAKLINLISDGLNFEADTSAKTVDDFLKENKIFLNEHDQILPEKNSPLYSGIQIGIKTARKIKIQADGKTIDGYALGKDIGSALAENKITLGRLDKTEPAVNFPASDNLKIIVTRINVEEKIIPEDIPFKVVSKNDAKLSWREKKVSQDGEKGIREVLYKITYKNGKEINRQKLSSKITKESVDEINVQGTYMELGKAVKGQGTWYAYMGGMFAASTTLPKGSYAKVTNTANGKSVVVQINDYGPQGKGRIIDLDKVAFAKIASLGAGVIGVKVEPVLN